MVINLTGNDGSTRSAVTDGNGNYLFPSLIPGVAYTAQCVAPAGYEYTTPFVQNPHTEGDNNADGSGGMGTYTLAPGESELSIDCGLVRLPASLGDEVWEDLNRNGLQDAGEPGIPGVVINLTGNDGSTRSAVTDGNGNYLFPSLIPGVAYTAQCVAPAGYLYTAPSVQTPQTEGDNNADATGGMGTYTLAAGESDLSIDCGLVRPATCVLRSRRPAPSSRPRSRRAAGAARSRSTC